MLVAASAAAACWLAVLLLPWRSWSTRERLAPHDPASADQNGPAEVTVLIPARNESATIAATVDAVIGQPHVARIVVVDDQSDDDTATIAGAISGVDVIHGRATPEGWSGKLWALQQGLGAVDTPLVLLLDADIQVAPGMVAALVDRLHAQRLDQISIMADLPTERLPEKLMLPAFVFFFKQLYPFAWVNRDDRPIAAAAGGCVLARREMLARAGAFESWKSTLIDDCELARRVRAAGGRIWLGLSHGVVSMRRHPDFGSVLETVRRTAYTQLYHNPILLILTLGMLALMFGVPPTAAFAGAVFEQPMVVAAGACGWGLCALAYLPQVRFSRLNPLWSLSLPLAAGLFAIATLDSAIRHHFGAGTGWKGRRYTDTG